jgi:hypothetical protein
VCTSDEQFQNHSSGSSRNVDLRVSVDSILANREQIPRAHSGASCNCSNICGNHRSLVAEQSIAGPSKEAEFFSVLPTVGVGRHARAPREAGHIIMENPNAELIDDSPLVFLETLSDATDRDAVDFDLMWTTFYIDAASYWTAAQPNIKRGRE